MYSACAINRFVNTLLKIFQHQLLHNVSFSWYQVTFNWYGKYLWAYGKIVYLGNRYIGKMQKGKNAWVFSSIILHMYCYYYSYIYHVNMRYIKNKYWISLIISFLIAFVDTYVCVDQFDSWWVLIRRRFVYCLSLIKQIHIAFLVKVSYMPSMDKIVNLISLWTIFCIV